jgi:putative SOS response-associated peptidase YedK
MCGRFTLTVEDVDFIAAGLGVPREQLNLYKPRYNVSPTDLHPILRMEYEQRVVDFAKWGLINWWNKDAKDAFKQINARAESIDTRPPFREAFRKHRCAVPADGFFEWTGPKTDRKPLWFHRPGDEMLFFAGLYDEWKPQPHQYEKTFTIVTTRANGLVEPIHDRMPVILSGDEVDAWIDPRNEDLAALKGMLHPVPDDYLVIRPVSAKLNSPKYDARDGLIEQPALL